MTYDIYLGTLWPILKIIQIFGGFPIKKSAETLCGFAPIKTACYLGLVLFVLSIGNIGQILSCYYIMVQYDVTLWKLLNIMFGLSGSIIDNFDLIGIQVFMVISNVGLAFGNIFLKDSFIELMELFCINDTNRGKAKDTRCRS